MTRPRRLTFSVSDDYAASPLVLGFRMRLACPHGGYAERVATIRALERIPTPWTLAWHRWQVRWLRRNALRFSRTFGCRCGSDVEQLIVALSDDYAHQKGERA